MLIYNDKYNTHTGNENTPPQTVHNNNSFLRNHKLQGICLFVISQDYDHTLVHDDIGLNSITQMNDIGCDLMSLLDESVSKR